MKTEEEIRERVDDLKASMDIERYLKGDSENIRRDAWICALKWVLNDE